MTLKTLTDLESATLAPLLAAGKSLAGASVVVEDVQDLNTEIVQAMSDIGLMILLGTPSFTNRSGTSPGSIVAAIDQEILIGEVPAVWRNAGDTNVHCQVAAQIVSVALQGLLLGTNQRLSVISGEPLGTFKGEVKSNPSVFQYYRLHVEVTMSLQP
jgi:hypothetical protein